MNKNDKVNLTYNDLVDLRFSEESIDKIYNKSLQNECNKDTQKIYLLVEQMMNGTVTMEIMSSGVKASSFIEAVSKIKEKIKSMEISTLNIRTDNNDEFSYIINSEIVIYGQIKNKELNII
jgi:hypothetical protein